MGFFKKDEIEAKEVPAVNQINLETKEIEKNSFRKKKLALFDEDTIKYVIDNFPVMSIEIQNGLSNLADILENTIDHIEDKSSEIVKKNRDFELSKNYRDTSIAIYNIVEVLGQYINWMQDEYEKNIKDEETKVAQTIKKNKNKNEEEHLQETNESVSNKINGEAELEIYKDFSLKEPKAFKLDDYLIMVDDWNDLLVKTAEVLTKNYRKNKNSEKVIKEIKPIEKKSTQNSFRDTVLEMLIEYKINFDEFKIIIK